MTTPAAAYYRMSNDQQEASIPRQRESVQAFAAKNGYHIVREYQDEGISGDATEKRDGFLRMREDVRKGDFRVILCWDKDRFGRFDSIEQGYWVKPIRDAGVRLVTVGQGAVDWDSFGGRIVDAALAESKHEFLRSLSRNTTAGQIRRAKAAQFTGGSVPYAFDRMLLNERAEPQRRLKRGEVTDRPRGWYTVLTPSDDLAELEIVRWLYDAYDTREVSLRTLANELNARGVPGPASLPGKPAPWGRGAVRKILDNRRYTGDFVWGETNMGKYSRAVNGEAQPVTGLPRTKSGGYRRQKNEDGAIVVPDAHPAIVDRALWERVQAKRRARRDNHRRPRGAGYLLGGLLRCGHCGGRMHGSKNTVTPGRRLYRRYVCGTFVMTGGCGGQSMREDHILPALVCKIRDLYLAPERLDALRHELRRQLEERKQAPSKGAAQLRKKVEKLDAEIRQGARNLLRAGDNIDLLNAELSTLRQERDRLAAELATAERCGAGPTADTARTVEAAIGKLAALREELDKADPDRLGAVLGELVSHVDLYFEAIPKRVKTHHRFARGVVWLRPQGECSSLGPCPLPR
jgi:DNA invertase Pin-like site-specific DNA recombinase